MNPALTERLGVLSGRHRDFEVLDEGSAQEETTAIRSLLETGRARERMARDVSDLPRDAVAHWLRSLPIDASARVTVLWPSYRAGIRVSYDDFVDNYDELWYPGADDVWLRDDEGAQFLRMDHEEAFTLFAVR